MSKNNQEPLDLEEVFPPEREVSITPLQRFVQNLEIIPLIILLYIGNFPESRQFLHLALFQD